MLDLPLLVRTAQRLQHIYCDRAVTAVYETLQACFSQIPTHLTELCQSVSAVAAEGKPVPITSWQRHARMFDRQVRTAVDEARTQLQTSAKPVPDLRFLIAELRQLDDEFDGLTISLRQRFVRVSSEPIVLDEVPLGRFYIHLPWANLKHKPGSHSFEVIAQTPNRAASNEEVTHPHVSGNAICAGDAQAPIRLALEQGRLCDAFCLIRSVLTHYGESSPYVPLSDWDGVSCYECGYSTASDNLSLCDQCENEFCSECIGCCDLCDRNACGACRERCSRCRKHCCSHCRNHSTHSERLCCSECLHKCSVCGQPVAIDELADEDQTCRACAPDEAPNDDPIDPSPVPQEPAHEPNPTPAV